MFYTIVSFYEKGHNILHLIDKFEIIVVYPFIDVEHGCTGV